METSRPQQPYQSQSAPNPPPSVPHPRRNEFVMILVIVGLLIGSYLFAAQRYSWWPMYVAVPSPTPTLTTYTSQEFSFQIQYPSNWHSEECRDEGLISSYLLVSFGDKPDLVVCNSDAPLMGYITIGASGEVPGQQEIQVTLESLDNAKRTNTTIDGQFATRVEGITKQMEGPGLEPGLNFVIIYTSKNGIGYRFIYSDIDKKDRREQFNQILSTFKFAG